MLKAYALLEHLINQNFLGRQFDREAAETQEEVQKITTMLTAVPELFHDMQSPSWDDGCLPLSYQDAFQHFVHVSTCNKLLAPRSFDSKAIMSESSAFLQALHRQQLEV